MPSLSQSCVEGLLFGDIAQVDFFLFGNGELSLELHVEFIEFFDSGFEFQIFSIEIFSIMSQAIFLGFDEIGSELIVIMTFVVALFFCGLRHPTMIFPEIL